METNGIGNVPNFQNANDVVNNTNNVAHKCPLVSACDWAAIGCFFEGNVDAAGDQALYNGENQASAKTTLFLVTNQL